MGKKQIGDEVGASAIADGDVPMSVRYLLQLIENRFPGGAVDECEVLAPADRK